VIAEAIDSLIQRFAGSDDPTFPDLVREMSEDSAVGGTLNPRVERVRGCQTVERSNRDTLSRDRNE
jgi:hypothetical protein